MNIHLKNSSLPQISSLVILGCILGGVFFGDISGKSLQAKDDQIIANIAECVQSNIEGGGKASKIENFYCPEANKNWDELLYYVITTTKQQDIERQVDAQLQQIMKSESSNYTLLSARVSSMFDRTPLEEKFPYPDRNYRDLLLQSCQSSYVLSQIAGLYGNNEFIASMNAKASPSAFPPLTTATKSLDSKYESICLFDMEKRVIAYRDLGLSLAYDRMALESEKKQSVYFSELSDTYEELLTKVTFYTGTIARIIAKFPNFTPKSL